MLLSVQSFDLYGRQPACPFKCEIIHICETWTKAVSGSQPEICSLLGIMKVVLALCELFQYLQGSNGNRTT